MEIVGGKIAAVFLTKAPKGAIYRHYVVTVLEISEQKSSMQTQSISSS